MGFVASSMSTSCAAVSVASPETPSAKRTMIVNGSSGSIGSNAKCDPIQMAMRRNGIIVTMSGLRPSRIISICAGSICCWSLSAFSGSVLRSSRCFFWFFFVSSRNRRSFA